MLAFWSVPKYKNSNERGRITTWTSISADNWVKIEGVIENDWNVSEDFYIWHKKYFHWDWDLQCAIKKLKSQIHYSYVWLENIFFLYGNIIFDFSL